MISENQFEIALKAGLFVLILDGFDELNYDVRDSMQKQIMEIHNKYPDTPIVVSSRPDNRFDSWTRFHVYTVDPLNKQQSRALVDSLPYDMGVKRRFLRQEIFDSLFDSHRSFLSSPLLATIMLLTFENFARIPNRIHAFYDKAFDTLFQKHDALKDQFLRQTRSGLSLEDFRDCFSAFCAFSYLREIHSFDDRTLSEMSKLAVRYVASRNITAPEEVSSERPLTSGRLLDTRAAKFDPDKISPSFIDDLFQAVCMLHKDGLETSFVHRSFQEYFAALFSTRVTRRKLKLMVDKFCLRPMDSVIPMLMEMHSEAVEADWVIPTIDHIAPLISEEQPSSLISRFQALSGAIVIEAHEDKLHIYMTIGADNILPLLWNIFRLYPRFAPSAGLILYNLTITLPHARKIFLDSRFKGKKEFQKLRQKIQLAQIKTYDIIRITDIDESLLESLGFRSSCKDVAASLTAIRKDIESRARHRSDIIDELF